MLVTQNWNFSRSGKRIINKYINYQDREMMSCYLSIFCKILLEGQEAIENVQN